VELTNYSNSSNHNIEEPKRARAVIYARVSTEDQAAEGKISIQQQLQACGKYAVAQGWDVIANYVEPGVTGETLDERPTLVSLLNDARLALTTSAKERKQGRAKPFDVIICYHSDRLARRGDIYQTLIELLENQIGIPVSPLNLNLPVDPLNFQPKTDDTRLMAHVMSGMLSQLDQRTRSRRLESAKKAYVEQGKWIAPRPPYGYYYSYIGDNTVAKRERIIEVDPVRLSVVREMYQMLLYKDYSLHQIAKALTDSYNNDPENCPLPVAVNGRTLDTWRFTTIRAMLRNPFYAGRLEYGRTKMLPKLGSNATSYTKIKTNAAKAEVVHGTHNLPTPVTPQEWEQAQMVVKKRLKSLKRFFEGETDNDTFLAPRSMNTTSPLSGLLKCKHCGTSYVLSVKRDFYYRQDEQPDGTQERVKILRYDRYRAYYTCNLHRIGDTHACTAPAPPLLNATDILQTVFDLVGELLTTPTPPPVPTTTPTKPPQSQSQSQSRWQKQLTVTIPPPDIADTRAAENNRVKAERIETRLAELAKQEKTLDRAMLSEAIDLEKYRELSADLKDERKRLQTDLASLQDFEKVHAQRELIRERQSALAQVWHELITPLYGTGTRGRKKGQKVLMPIAEWEPERAQEVRRALQAIFAKIEVIVSKDPATGAKSVELIPHLLT
jgi:DNA invertase Pin-like site-specific DNA recombinase